MSEKRKKVLLLLKDRAMETGELLEYLSTSRQSLLPQLKILETSHLVTHYDDIYELTTVGKLLVEKMEPLLDTIEVINVDVDYWGTHNLDFIPYPLLERIKEINDYEIISPPFEDLYSVHRSFHDIEKTKSVHVVATVLYPNYLTLFNDMIKSNININIIFSTSLLAKIRAEHSEEFRNYIKNECFNLFVYNKKMKFLFFTYGDYYLVLNLLRINGEFDSRYIQSSSKSALKWGADFFDYCLKDSTRITHI